MVFSIPVSIVGIAGVEVLVSVVGLYQGTIKDSIKLSCSCHLVIFGFHASYQAKKGVIILARVIDPNYHYKLP